jgi:hypothetical protein
MMTDQPKRYVGLDVHKNYVMVGAVNRTQEMVLPPRKVGLADFADWAKKQLRPTDEVVLEATTNAWYLYDLLEPLVEWVVVCHPPQVKLIAAALVKTDKKDTMTLAKLLAVGMIPPVWVPPVHVRELRALMSHRQRLIAQQTRTTQSWRTVPGRTGCARCCSGCTSFHPKALCSAKPSATGGPSSTCPPRKSYAPVRICLSWSNWLL